MATYYYYKDGLRFETSSAALKELAKSGTLEPDTIIEIDGQRHEAQKFKELAAIFELLPKIGILEDKIDDDVRGFLKTAGVQTAKKTICGNVGATLVGVYLLLFVFFLCESHFIQFVLSLLGGLICSFIAVYRIAKFQYNAKFEKKKQEHLKSFPPHQWTIIPSASLPPKTQRQKIVDVVVFLAVLIGSVVCPFAALHIATKDAHTPPDYTPPPSTSTPLYSNESTSPSNSSPKPSTPPPAPKENIHGAWTYATFFVERELYAPKTAKYQFGAASRGAVTSLGFNRYRVQSYVDAENRFGAKTRSDFSLVIKENGSSWTLEGGITFSNPDVCR